MTAEAGFRELLAGRLAGRELDRMVRYAELLEQWSERHSLVRVANRQELVRRHILDALEGVHLLEGGGVLLDVGSGAGLPGVPLLVVRPAWRGVLLEPRQKRWAFLKRVIRELELDAEAEARRYQDLRPSRGFDLITARALGGHSALLEWAPGRLTENGGVALWTTVDGEHDLSRLVTWRVLSWPLVGLDRGRLVYLRPRIGGPAR